MVIRPIMISASYGCGFEGGLMNATNEWNELNFDLTDLGIPSKERGGANRGQGRKRKGIDFEIAAKLANLFCTKSEIATFLDIDEKTLSLRIKEKYGQTFSEWFYDASGSARAKLRVSMFEMAMSGNPTMLIWLSKQYLGMSDKNVISLSNTVPTINFVYSKV